MQLPRAGKRDVRSQFGALPWRIKNGKVEVLIITSRGTGSWILPKGWPMDGATPAEAAATEAYEEAGVEGVASNLPAGFYAYTKAHAGDDLPIVVALFPLRVKKIHKTWPERRDRKRKWMSRKKAAALLTNRDVARIVRNFDPRPAK